MSRIRSVHPGIYTDEAWASVSIMARWLGVALLTEADDNGIFEWKPLQLKMRIFPADNLNIADLLAELAEAKIICAYFLGGRQLGAIRNFCDYQKPRKPKAWFPISENIKQFVGLISDEEPETDDDLFAAGSEPHSLNGDTVPKKSELGIMMEDGGWRMEEGGGSIEEETPTPFEPPEPIWGEFIAFRKRIKSPMTDHAKKLALRELEGLARGGHDPTKVIERSILNGWKGLFPLKDEGNGKHSNNRRNGGTSARQTDGFQIALRDVAGRET